MRVVPEDSSRATGTTRIQGNVSIASGGTGGLLTGINILGDLNIGDRLLSSTLALIGVQFFS
jgi:hypothetical protein